MKEIECPSCGELIPDDSKYCDMCGAELLECVNCGALGCDRFCADCGKPMVARRVNASVVDNADQTYPKVKTSGASEGDKTIGGRRKSLVLKARKGNYILRPVDDAIIGRLKGTPYCDLLADCDLISRTHGKFVRKGRDWYIVDLGSTNGTLVNDEELDADTPAKLTQGDVVDIGTYIFDVIEQ